MYLICIVYAIVSLAPLNGSHLLILNVNKKPHYSLCLTSNISTITSTSPVNNNDMKKPGCCFQERPTVKPNTNALSPSFPLNFWLFVKFDLSSLIITMFDSSEDTVV